MTNPRPLPLAPYAIKYGLYIALACIAYFLIMRLIGMQFEVEFSLLNGIIMSVGILLVLKNFKRAKNGAINYLEGLGLGFMTSAIAALLFGAFIILYGMVIDSHFLESTNANEFFGRDISKLTMFGYVVLEMLISGALAAFVFMQYFKRPDHKLSN
jgi:hypothetical protein